MHDLLWVKILAVLAVGALLVKRAVRGPQQQLARLACLSEVVGTVALSGASQQGDLASWVGALLIIAGLLVAIVMVLADMQWTVRAGLASWKRND